MLGARQVEAACPLCDCERARRSWLGSTAYHGREFEYVQCLGCGSLYCTPMPDAEVLAAMYGLGYGRDPGHDGQADTIRERDRVLTWLRRLSAGVFVDYGCGDGSLLLEAVKLKWQAIGVEYDDEVAKAVEARPGVRVVSDARLLELTNGRPVADVLHLGDVIEHLTDPRGQVGRLFKLLRTGGIVLARGPLEGNANLFTLVLRVVRWLRGRPRANMAPYHVLLGTVKGQRAFFRRLGLEELEWSVSEVACPAPSKLSLPELRQPRAVGLFLVRRMSQLVSSLCPNEWGNRYFYAGRLAGDPRRASLAQA